MQLVKRPIMALVAVIGMVVAAMAFSVAASAYPPGVAPVIALSTSVAPDGSSLTVTGANFVPNEGITLELHSAVSTIGSTTSDGNGSFVTGVTLTPGVEGQHTIVAIGATGDSASAPILITGAGTGTGGGNGGGGGGLSNTGVATLSIGGFGVLLLLGGGLMLMAGRRRKAVV